MNPRSTYTLQASQTVAKQTPPNDTLCWVWSENGEWELAKSYYHPLPSISEHVVALYWSMQSSSSVSIRRMNGNDKWFPAIVPLKKEVKG